MEPALESLAKGTIDVESMVSEELPLSRAGYAFARAAQPGIMKVLLRAV
jgi:threonine dehydrogenase-like Zn-dependent dehydrogenase